MREFRQSVVIDAPVEEVFAFHERPDALELLTPPFPPVRVERRSGGLEPGSTVELRVMGLPWVARHGTLIRNRLFTDEQTSGPFAIWRHRHEFEDNGGRTRLTDRVQYALPGGAWIEALFGWAVDSGLRRMFRHRHEVTRRVCESASQPPVPETARM